MTKNKEKNNTIVEVFLDNITPIVLFYLLSTILKYTQYNITLSTSIKASLLVYVVDERSKRVEWEMLFNRNLGNLNVKYVRVKSFTEIILNIFNLIAAIYLFLKVDGILGILILIITTMHLDIIERIRIKRVIDVIERR